MKNLYILLLMLFWSLSDFAQERKLPISVSVFNLGSSLPGTGYLGVFSKNIHPGFNLGTYHLYHTGNKHEFFQTFKLGYFYHRFSQHAIQLYSEAGYRYLSKSGLYGEALLGVGYLHSFPDVQIFEFRNGQYRKKTNFGRPQMMLSTSFGLGYDLQKKMNFPMRVFILYQLFLQTPFVNKYVPLLPNTALHLGVCYVFTKRKE